MKKMILATLTATLFTGFLAQAQEALQFGTMISGGTGCPAGNQPSLQINNGHGQIVFDPYSVDLQGRAQAFDRKSCNIRLPISVAEGLQIGVKLIDTKGSVSLSKKSTATVSSLMTFVGASQNSLSQQFSGRMSQNYLIQATVANDYSWSGCSGKDAMLSVNTSVLATHAKATQAALVSIDEINFEFVVRSCAQ